MAAVGESVDNNSDSSKEPAKNVTSGVTDFLKRNGINTKLCLIEKPCRSLDGKRSKSLKNIKVNGCLKTTNTPTLRSRGEKKTAEKESPRKTRRSARLGNTEIDGCAPSSGLHTQGLGTNQSFSNNNNNNDNTIPPGSISALCMSNSRMANCVSPTNNHCILHLVPPEKLHTLTAESELEDIPNAAEMIGSNKSTQCSISRTSSNCCKNSDTSQCFANGKQGTYCNIVKNGTKLPMAKSPAISIPNGTNCIKTPAIMGILNTTYNASQCKPVCESGGGSSSDTQAAKSGTPCTPHGLNKSGNSGCATNSHICHKSGKSTLVATKDGFAKLVNFSHQNGRCGATNGLISKPKCHPIGNIGNSKGLQPPKEDAVVKVNCKWSRCGVSVLETGLLDHIMQKHVEKQIIKNDHERYVCLWDSCKVYNRASCSQSWLEKHVIGHVGDKPFLCIVEGCSQRFASQNLLEKHVNNHFTSQQSIQNKMGRNKEDTPSKHTKKRKLKRKSCYKRKRDDYFDASIMENLKYRLIKMNETTSLESTPEGPAITFQSTVIAKHIEEKGITKVLLRWTPPNILPDTWVPESQALSMTSQPIPLAELPRDIITMVDPTLHCQHRFRKHRRK